MAPQMEDCLRICLEFVSGIPSQKLMSNDSLFLRIGSYSVSSVQLFFIFGSCSFSHNGESVTGGHRHTRLSCLGA